jgi:hypothetical protein
MLDAILRADGVRSGLYTSPHLLDFRERIQLDGTLIPEAAVAEGLTKLRQACGAWEQAPTFFELATVLAAWWFAQEKADLIVWETGMGGRLDATNAVRPLVTAITPIGLDHREWLGPDLASIAAEKAGIFKPGVPAVSAPQEAPARLVLEEKAREVGAPLTFVTTPCSDPVGLPGEHQRWNAALALAALDAAGLAVADEARRAGLAGVQWPARFQQVGPRLVVDGRDVAGDVRRDEGAAGLRRDEGQGRCKDSCPFARRGRRGLARAGAERAEQLLRGIGGAGCAGWLPRHPSLGGCPGPRRRACIGRAGPGQRIAFSRGRGSGAFAGAQRGVELRAIDGSVSAVRRFPPGGPPRERRTFPPRGHSRPPRGRAGPSAR